MSKAHVDGGDIAICAAVGSAMAGVVLGIGTSMSLLSPSAGIADAIPMLLMFVLAGAFSAVFIGTPIGLVLGLVISRLFGKGIGYAALTGALTGIAYPLFILVYGVLVGASGLSTLTESFVLFGAVGAACGAGAYWLVIGRRSRPT